MAGTVSRKRTPNASLADIREVIEKTIEEAVPKAMHAEFLRLGLATEDDDDQLSAQQDFAFLRKMRLGAEAAQGVVGRRIVNWTLALIALLAIAGIGALVHGQTVAR